MRYLPSLAGAALALSTLVAPPAGADNDAAAAAQVIESFDQALLSVMKRAGQLGYEGRYAALAPVIDRTFDIPLMTRIVVGTDWNSWTDEQRKKVIEAFRRFIVATYARRFDDYSGEQFVVEGTRPANGGALVSTEIMRPHDTPVTLNYQLRDNGSGKYQVVDVFLTGTISELATRRSEFGSVLRQGGYQKLLAALAEKAEDQGP